MPQSLIDAEPADGFARLRVPEAAQGSGWRVFFIVAGSLCGLPVFILGAQVSAGLGFRAAVIAAMISACVMALLAAFSAYAGSRTRMTLAMLSDLAFGRLGGRAVKLVIALSLVGWFGVNVSVLGATASDALLAMSGFHLAAPFISIPVSVLIAIVAIRGATGLERLGMILIPIAVLILIASVWLTADRLGGVLASRGSGALSFGAAVSAIIGSYMVGIIIQPDYGRFVRKPYAAALGAAGALGIAFPVVLLASSVASVALVKPDLISAMIVLGFGAPALIVLFMGAWIDASACLYSGGLSLANQFSRFSLRTVIIAVTIIGVALSLVHAERAFVPFLMLLGVALPPIATVQVAEALWPRVWRKAEEALPPSAVLAWLAGVFAGGASSAGLWRLTGVSAIDSILVSAAVVLVSRLVGGWIRRSQGAHSLAE
jgi:cytosine permease